MFSDILYMHTYVQGYAHIYNIIIKFNIGGHLKYLNLYLAQFYIPIIFSHISSHLFKNRLKCIKYKNILVSGYMVIIAFSKV